MACAAIALLGFVGVLVANTGDVTSTLTDAKQFNDLRAAVCPKQPLGLNALPFPVIVQHSCGV